MVALLQYSEPEPEIEEHCKDATLALIFGGRDKLLVLALKCGRENIATSRQSWANVLMRRTLHHLREETDADIDLSDPTLYGLYEACRYAFWRMRFVEWLEPSVLSEHSTTAAFQHWAAIAIGSYQHERRASARDWCRLQLNRRVRFLNKMLASPVPRLAYVILRIARIPRAGLYIFCCSKVRSEWLRDLIFQDKAD